MHEFGLSIDAYMRVVGLGRTDQDGPVLLVPEIVATFHGCRRVWVPFAASADLSAVLRRVGVEVVQGDARHGWHDIPSPGPGIDGAYFGVPTVVSGAALFGAEGWTVERARAAARQVTTEAFACGARVVVSGLGSGDISEEERRDDMRGSVDGPVKVVAYKDFGDFQDWVVAKWR